MHAVHTGLKGKARRSGPDANLGKLLVRDYIFIKTQCGYNALIQTEGPSNLCINPLYTE